ncbi:LOW QUALITY PROTEIN: hypothetical protein Cgig2_028615 [Carnegiea gigantea]|uniref:Uncharacterized protein n=1 Tax=Carnegiea gigantea TaxID=171969 RepID=A0A9Q1K6R3_9CARY|nr:LOW QUALITY PROTEIN: hypothetical protein Cgig2_028615 [Carnegiea gigantea]
MEKSIDQVRVDDVEERLVSKIIFDAFSVLFLVALFDEEALDAVANEGEEDMSGSETTNRSLKSRLRATADLCDFYNIFYDVVSESKKNGEDHRYRKGNVEMAFPSINILKHAMPVYIVEAFLMFEKEFIDGAGYNFKAIESSSSAMSFEVWGIRFARESHGEEPYEFQHIVNFNKEEGGHEKVLNSLPNVLNPPGSRQKGVRNKRFKSIIERKCDQVKRRKSKKLSKNDVGSSTTASQITLPTFNHSSLVPHDQHRVGSFPLPSFHPTYYFHSANSNSVFMPVMAPPVLQQLHSDVIHTNDSHNDKH